MLRLKSTHLRTKLFLNREFKKNFVRDCVLIYYYAQIRILCEEKTKLWITFVTENNLKNKFRNKKSFKINSACELPFQS